MELQPKDVELLLVDVMDPELGSSIVDLGMVRNIFINGDAVTVEIALTTLGCPLRSRIQKSISDKISQAYPNATIEMTTVEMTLEQKQRAMQIARSNVAKNPPENSIPVSANVIAIASGKGGVGKSTISAQLAFAIASKGFTVGLLDADIWGFSAPKLLGLNERVQASGSSHNWKIKPISSEAGKGQLKVISMGLLTEESDTAIMWRGLVLNRAFQHFVQDVDWSGLDYLIIDMPPGTGDIQMGLSRLIPTCKVLVVTIPNDSATQVALRMVDMAKKGNLEVIGIIENMSYFECEHGERYKLFGTGSSQDFAASANIDIVAKIPFSDRSRSESLTVQEKFSIFSGAPELAETISLADKIINELAPLPQMDSCTTRIFELLKVLDG